MVCSKEKWARLNVKRYKDLFFSCIKLQANTMKIHFVIKNMPYINNINCNKDETLFTWIKTHSRDAKHKKFSGGRNL